MGHRPRYIPEGNHLVEVTTRTLQGRYFLKPTPEVNEIILGIIGRAQRMHRMEICLLVFMSSHYHMLLVPTDADQLARFMGYVNGQIAKKILPFTDWDSRFWSRPFDAILVTDEPAAQRARFEYLLSHGVKEGLVERPEQWIGIHGIDAWLRDRPLRGYWFDKSREARARRRIVNRDRRFGRLAFADQETVRLSMLPCWCAEGLDLEQVRREIEAMIERIVERARLERERAGRRRVAGVKRILAKRRDFRPRSLDRSPRPLFHFRSGAAFERWFEAYQDFLLAYRRASKAFRTRDRSARFPERCFPPASPFTFDGRVG